ncbi:hypothetical protein J2X87_002493 [Pseudomonas synxantha]|uniref:Uncharacterized protein n=1 Tax=Pseudomonas synxantha TaxID=47883 RepID=A0ACC6JM01_9PSED|nr:hypothetical protein [Pseudomonas synxantha]
MWLGCGGWPFAAAEGFSVAKGQAPLATKAPMEVLAVDLNAMVAHFLI